ncbi:MAG TPA: DNA cytosine methyltransferase [Frankiaceae bacterium]|nr:DNA cytosine methyltransferase [Frankiaceae bacterium]
MATSVELFAGGGGMALGLHLAGFDHLRLVEWDERACDTLRLNATRPDPTIGQPPWAVERVECGDVRKFAAERAADYHGIDLVAGGPPCQPFSLGGLHAGDNDERNMFPAALDVVRACVPKMVVFENVPGLLRPSFKPYFDYVRDQLEAPSVVPRRGETWHDHWARVRRRGPGTDVRYRVARQVILAADVGVGQSRRRVFLIGIREDLGVEWGELAGDHSEDALLYDKYVSGSYWEEHADDPVVRGIVRSGLPQAPSIVSRRIARLRDTGRPSDKRWRTVRDVLREPEPLPTPVDGEQRGQWPNHVGVPGARSYPGHTGSDIDAPAKTIKAGVHGVCGGEAMIRFSDGSLRYMTTREAARVQGFPDWYEFTGARSHAMRHIGNAVAVRVAQAVGERLRTLTGV